MLSKTALYAAGVLLWPISTQWGEPNWPDPGNVPADLAQSLADSRHGRSSATQAERNADVRKALDEKVRSKPICVIWTKTWAGDLGHSVLYRLQHLSERRVLVGYFVYWTTERAWGDNELTRWLLPAVAIDGIYSHLLFVLPGLQRLIYGPGDVEGVRVTYKLGQDGHLEPESLVADDEAHQEIRLPVSDAVDEQGRIVVYNDVWSHQLGGRGAAHKARTGAACRCYSQELLVPLSPKAASAFRLGSPSQPHRAGPAWRNDP